MAIKKGSKVKLNTNIIQKIELGQSRISLSKINLSDCNIYGKIAEVPRDKLGKQIDPENPETFKWPVEIYKVIHSSNLIHTEQFFFPPIKNLILNVKNTEYKEVQTSDSTKTLYDQILKTVEDKEENLQAFYKLEKYDKVVIKDHSVLTNYFVNSGDLSNHVVLALVKNVKNREIEGVIELELRSVINTGNKEVKKLEQKTVLNEYGINEKIKFMVLSEHIRKAKPADEWKCYKSIQGKGEYDKLAIHLPGYFYSMKGVADYSWEKILHHYKEGHLSHNMRDQFGGQDSLLEYRSWLVEYVLKRLQEIALIFARTTRTKQMMEQLDNNIETYLSDEKYAGYVKDTSPIGWAAPGSQEATSDIDLNTWGDGTEWVSTVFNYIMAKMHAENEPGIVYDVNFYAQDFKPNTRGFPRRKADDIAKEFDAEYLHDFIDKNLLEKDVKSQIIAGLIKARRYLNDPEWEKFKTFVHKRFIEGDRADKIAEFDKPIEKAESKYLMFRSQLAESISRMNKGEKLPDWVEPHNQDALSRYAEIIDHPKLNPNTRMAAENRLYEDRLLYGPSSVFDSRKWFTLFKYKAKKNFPTTLGSSLGFLDDLYCELRHLQTNSLYFANEAYCTEGAVTAVVAGKQSVSRGVTIGRDGKLKKHNIRYSVHQLMTSLYEQVGDFFKESTRHYEHATAHGTSPEKAYGESIVLSSKYLHRFFNAMKHFYKILHDKEKKLEEEFIKSTYEILVESDSQKEETEDKIIANWEGYPEILIKKENQLPLNDTDQNNSHLTKKEAFEIIRRACGFGMEQLKKFEFENAKSEHIHQLEQKLGWKYVKDQIATPELKNSSLSNFKKENNSEIAKTVIKTYFNWFSQDIIDNNTPVFVDITSLDKLKKALTYLLAELVGDYYEHIYVFNYEIPE